MMIVIFTLDERSADLVEFSDETGLKYSRCTIVHVHTGYVNNNKLYIYIYIIFKNLKSQAFSLHVIFTFRDHASFFLFFLEDCLSSCEVMMV